MISFFLGMRPNRDYRLSPIEAETAQDVSQLPRPDNPPPRIVMTMQHCYICNMIYRLMWVMCFKRIISTHPCYEIKVTHKERKTPRNTFFQVRLYQDIYSSKNIPLIVKWLSRHEVSLACRDELLFYDTIVPHLGLDAIIIPRCYMLKDYPEYQVDFIVMEDLAAQGYKAITRKLDEEHLRFCLISLARFHRHMFKLQEEQQDQFEKFCKSIKNSCDFDQARMRQLKKIRYNIRLTIACLDR